MINYKTSQIKAMLSFLKKTSRTRPILKCVEVADGKMIFTNAYAAFWLDQDVPELPHVTEALGRYPKMDSLYDTYHNKMFYEAEKSVNLDVAKFKNAISLKAKLVRLNGWAFDVYLLKSAMAIMNTNKFYITNKPNTGFAHIKNEYGYALILGIRAMEGQDLDDLIEVTESEDA